MSINVGKADRTARFVLGAILIVLPFLLGWSGLVGMILPIVVGLVMIVTAAMRFCPAYTLFGIRTCEIGAKE